MNAKELGAQPAHPSSSGHQDQRNQGWVGNGLTKRELFAAMAMQGALSNPAVMVKRQQDADRWDVCVAEASVGMADLLLAELAKEQP